MIRLFAITAFIFSLAAEARPTIVNAIGCSLFDMQGKLQKKYLGWVCAFFPNGKMILGDGFTLTFYDKDMNPLWSKDMHTHHMINYSEKDNTALVIASNLIGDDTRIDRLEIYNNDGKLLKFFNFTEKESLGTYKQDWDMPVLPKVKRGITLVESFHRIDKTSKKHPSLREGNYIVYDGFGRIYIFDRALKEIIQTFDLKNWSRSQWRDVQVTDSGNFLAYNSGNELAGKKFTTLEEVDPASGKQVWEFRANPPESIYGEYEGNVQILKNGNLLFSVVMDEYRGKDRKEIPEKDVQNWMNVQGPHRSFEITRQGKMVWNMVNDGSGLSGMPNVVRRLDLTSYLKNKGRF
jgi:hypothetical protein